MINQVAQMGGVPPKRTYCQADPSPQSKKSWSWYLKGVNGHIP